jgi:hypothetical protein
MDLGKTLVVFGIVLVVLGLLLHFAPTLRLGRSSHAAVHGR